MTSPLGRAWRWLMSMGLAVPIIAGLALVVLVVVTLVSDRYHAPTVVDAGNTSDYAVNAPKYFEEERFWLVRLESGEFLALYDRDPITGCTVPWDQNHELDGRTGWFRDACSSSTYDLTGGCFDGQCQIGLNRLDVTVANGRISVDPRSGERGILRSDNTGPVNPQP